MSSEYTSEEIRTAIYNKTRSFRSGSGTVISDRADGLVGSGIADATATAEETVTTLFFYGGFLVCESCPTPFAERIAAALNFVEGLSTEYLKTRRMKEMIPDLRDEEVNVLPMVM